MSNKYPDDVRVRAYELAAEGLSQRVIVERLGQEFRRSPREETVRGWLAQVRDRMEGMETVATDDGDAAATEPDTEKARRLYDQANRGVLKVAVDRLNMLLNGSKTVHTGRQLKEIQAIIEKCEARDPRLRGIVKKPDERGEAVDQPDAESGGVSGVGARDSETVLTPEQQLRSLRESILGLDEPIRDGIVAGLQGWVDARRAEALSQ